MEFDVLNEIITGTVARLFTDLNKHANFTKTSSQMGQDKSEIPRNDGGNMSSRSEMRGGGAAEDSPVAQWLMVDAKQRLMDTMTKLGLDGQKISGKHLQTYAFEELMQEKKKVKNELKYYDQAFVSRFSRPPSRTEKEPMRMIYMYYKKLKQYITKAQANAGSSMVKKTTSTTSLDAGKPGSQILNNPSVRSQSVGAQ
jgi:hypothetical protein